MNTGKAFELFVKRVLINVGFSEVKSDGVYVFDGTAGQMVQGLGDAHNADVLLDPPVQIPFFNRVRLLVECKYYEEKIGLNFARSALRLREDINHFNLVDKNELLGRRSQRRNGITECERFLYQVAIVALNGYTIPAQNFAAAHRIPLLGFDKMPFWERVKNQIDYIVNEDGAEYVDIERRINELADCIGKRVAIAVTNSGQMLFLYRNFGESFDFADEYSLYWVHPEWSWKMLCGKQEYIFQLPENIAKQWLEQATTEFEMRKEAVACKENFLSHMIVYYSQGGQAKIKMISISKSQLEKAKRELEESKVSDSDN